VKRDKALYIRPRPQRRSNPWRILVLLILIGASTYAYLHIQQQQEEITVPFVPTATPTRSPISYRQEAETAYSAGDLVGAIAAYERAIRLEPDNVSLLVPLVRLLVLEGQVEQAIEQGERAVSLAPESPAAWAVLGMAYDWDGRVDEAIDACRRAISLDPACPEAYAYLAEAYADSGRWGEATQAARTALELAPDSVDAHRDYGYVLEMMGNWSGAIQAYRQALELHPNLAYIYMDLGRNYLYLTDTASAIQAFRQAAQIDPTRADALDQLGWAYYAIDDPDQARIYLEQAIQADPQYAPAYGHLGMLYYLRRNYEDAIPNLERTIDLAYQDARRRAGRFYVTVETPQEDFLFPSTEVVLSGDLAWSGHERLVRTADLRPQISSDRWTNTQGRLTLDTASGAYTLTLQGMPAPPAGQVYVGWFAGISRPNRLPLNTGPLSVGSGGSLVLQSTAEPVAGPRIEHLYILGFCYYYMDRCDLAYPLFETALLIDPLDTNAPEGIRLCQEAEGNATQTP